MTTASYFVSDLHMFSRRSRAEQYFDEIRSAADRAEVFVLGGDIFDFRWSTLPSIGHTIDAAIEWLDELIGPRGHCQFHFVLGNHDSNLAFIERLDTLSNRLPNLSWHHYFVRLGSSLFLHGDVADRTMDEAALAKRRAKWDEHRQKGPVMNVVYDLAIEARMHKVATALVHRQAAVVKRITSYLNHIGHGVDNGLQHVYFGHTHAHMTNYEHAGLKFHNGGAPMKGLKFRILPAEISV